MVRASSRGNRSAHRLPRRVARAFAAAATSLLFAAPAGAVTLVGITTATLSWSPAPGPVAAYFVYINRNGDWFPPFPETILPPDELSITVNAALGDFVMVRVAAVDEDGQIGPWSAPSEVLNFVAPGAPPLGVSTSQIQRTVGAGSIPVQESFFVRNTGAAALDFTASAVGAPSWLSLLPASGSIEAGQDREISLTFDPTGLGVGSYRTTISVGVPGIFPDPVTVEVEFQIVPAALEVSSTAMRISASPGRDAAPRSFQLRNASGGVLSYTIDVDQPWMSVAPSTGSSAGEPDTITVSFATGGLARGDYAGQISILAPGATGAPGTIQVSLTVGAHDGVASFHPKAGRWWIRRAEADSLEDSFSYGGDGFVPLYGDWDGDGVATVGVFETSTAIWYLRNGPGAGTADRVFQYGPGGAIPVTGDWNGDQSDGIGVYVPSTATWYLRNAANAGAPDAGVFPYGYGGVRPVVGDWNGDGTDTAGIYDPRTGDWLLRNAPGGGAPGFTFRYGYAGTLPVAGDWDGDGADGVGLFDPAQGTWLVRNTATGGAPDRVISTPRAKGSLPVRVPGSAADLPAAVDATVPSGPGDLVALFDVPTGEWLLQYDLPETSLVRALSYGAGGSFTAVHGDWDGDGIATLGVYQAATGRWYLRNRTGPGPADVVLDYGFPGTVPVVGDWDGDGRDTVGLYYPVTAQWLLRNQNTPGSPDLAFTYGFGGVQPVVGDWNADGVDTVGVYHAASGAWYLTNAAGGGAAALVFSYGYPGTVPIAGDWNGDGADGVGLYDRATGRLLLRNGASPGSPDIITSIQGRSGGQPLVWRP